MHQRTVLSLISLPLVALYSWPVVMQNLGASREPRPAARQEAKPTAQDPLAGLADIQDVLGIVRDNYVDRPDMEKVVQGGLLATLERAHPLNAYLSPEDLRLPDPGPADVGLKVVKRGIYAQVVAVRPGSPAAESGFQTGDVIRRINGESLKDVSAWALERLLRGSEGSEVTLLRYASGATSSTQVKLFRARPARLPLAVRRDDKALVVSLPDLESGRAEELKAALAGADPKLPLVLDLRVCMGGDLAEAAKAAGCFTAQPAPVATVQEAGGREGEVKETAVAAAPAGLPALPRAAVLVGPGTWGAPEALASGLKKLGIPVYGERTAGLGVERSRILLRRGGAVEIVTRRWVGAGGEKLDRAGLEPTTVLRGLKATEDPLPNLLPLLEAKPDPKAADKAAPKTAQLLRPASLKPASAGEVA
jgi:carboxyl-terminal processing protease